MKPARPRQYSAVGFNMTPMIDIVFLLIIFFLLSSHLARRESQIELPLPAAATGEQAPETSSPRITLNVLPSGQILMSGRMIPISELPERLHRALAESADDLELRIRADRGVAYREVTPILVAAARAGLWNVTFAVVPDSEPL